MSEALGQGSSLKEKGNIPAGFIVYNLVKGFEVRGIFSKFSCEDEYEILVKAHITIILN